MKIYQLIMKGGLTRNIEAKGYSKGKRGLAFMLDDGGTLRLPCSEVIMIEEILDEATAGAHSGVLWGRPLGAYIGLAPGS